MPEKHVDSYNGQEFEVTEADMALVYPLGTENPIDDDERQRWLINGLKHLIKRSLPHFVLPTGHWDAFIDEGDSQCGVADCPDGDYCCDANHHLVTRTSTTRFDSVFVRMQTDVVPEPIWDVEISTRDGKGGNLEKAVAEINSEEITPEALVRDLGVLLSVFRLYVQQGRI